MKRRTLAISVLASSIAGLLLTLTLAAEESKPLQTVSSVDLDRYVGKWYEISRYPNKFQKECASDTTAEYTLAKDGKIKVVNSCRKSDGKLKQSKGTAKVVDKKSNAKLKVTFFWPFYGDYWIIDLGKDYEYAVVSEPKREYLWILSRTPSMAPEQYSEILSKLSEKGFDTSRLIKTKQQ